MDTFTSLRLSPPYTQDGGAYLLGHRSRDAQGSPLMRPRSRIPAEGAGSQPSTHVYCIPSNPSPPSLRPGTLSPASLLLLQHEGPSGSGLSLTGGLSQGNTLIYLPQEAVWCCGLEAWLFTPPPVPSFVHSFIPSTTV